MNLVAEALFQMIRLLFWPQQAPDLLNAFVQHFAALSVDDPVMTALQSEHAWVGGHLVDSLQLAATPQHIQSLMELWLANAVSSFATTTVYPPALASATLVSPLSPPPADVPPAATSPPATSSGAPALAPVLPAPDEPFGPTIASPAHAHPLPSPFSCGQCASVPLSPSPFASVAQTPPVSSHDPPQVSGPFAPRPDLSVRASPVRSQLPPLSLSLAHPDSLASLRCRLIGTSMFSRH